MTFDQSGHFYKPTERASHGLKRSVRLGNYARVGKLVPRHALIALDKKSEDCAQTAMVPAFEIPERKGTRILIIKRRVKE